MTGHERYIDQEARDLANRAIAMIESHERVCVEAAKASADWRDRAGDTLTRIESQVGGVYSRMWWAAGGVMGAMFIVIMALLANHS